MFSKGELVDYQTIESGIENSNYFVTLEEPGGKQEYVLTIMESLGFDDLAYFNSLVSHLRNYGLPVAPPERTLDGMTTTIFCGKPTLLTKRLPGNHPTVITENQCAAMGKALAEIHTSKPKINKSRDNPFDLEWTIRTRGQLKELDATEQDLAETVINNLKSFAESKNKADLPTGIVHADLFPDNTLFEGDNLTGLIDFYHACTDYLAQDLAITINAWCRQEDASLNLPRLKSLLSGYQSERQLTSAEVESLPLMLKTGALNFFFTRHLSKTDGDFLKDPKEFFQILAHDMNTDPGSVIQDCF